MILPIARRLAELGAEVIIVLGARTSESVLFEEEFASFAELVVCTDDGTAGRAGMVTDVLGDLLATRSVDVVYAAGPVPMMRAVAAVTRPLAWTIVSLNPIMVDGTGMCGGCRVTVDGAMRFACVDGPEFDGHGVDFDELSDRLSTYGEYERAASSQVCRGRREWRAAPKRERLTIGRQEMPTRDPRERSGTFDEVNLGFTEHLAMLEAQRCLACKGDVRRGVSGDGRHSHVHQAHRGRRPRRGGVLFVDNALPGVTGRVCPRSISVRRSARGRGRAGGHRPPRALRRRLGPGPFARGTADT